MLGFKAKRLSSTTIDGMLDRLVRSAREDGGDGTITVYNDPSDMSKGAQEFAIRRGKVPAAALHALRRSLAGEPVQPAKRATRSA